MVDIKKPSFWILLVALILAIVCAGLIATRVPAMSFQKMEVVHAVYYGFLIVLIICFVSVLVGDEMENTGIGVSALGFILYIAAGALCLEFRDKAGADDFILAAGILGIFVGAFLLVLMVLQILKK